MDTVRIKIAKTDKRGGKLTYTYNNDMYWFLANDVAATLNRQNVYYLCGRSGWENVTDFMFGKSTRKKKFISTQGINKLYTYWRHEDKTLLNLVNEISNDVVDVIQDIPSIPVDNNPPSKPLKVVKQGKQRQIDNLHAIVVQHRKDLDYMFEEIHNLRERVFAYIPKIEHDEKD